VGLGVHKQQCKPGAPYQDVADPSAHPCASPFTDCPEMASNVVRMSNHCCSSRSLICNMKISAEPVTISYQQLSGSPESLRNEITMAFGSNFECLGIILIKDLPEEYSELRERLLLLAYKFAHLDESVREKYSDPSTHYRCDNQFTSCCTPGDSFRPSILSFGWSHGKEIMNGVPDMLKGSYYANPTVDRPEVSAVLKAEYPCAMPSFEYLYGFLTTFVQRGVW
jgi:hypothetical protein